MADELKQFSKLKDQSNKKFANITNIHSFSAPYRSRAEFLQAFKKDKNLEDYYQNLQMEFVSKKDKLKGLAFEETQTQGNSYFNYEMRFII